MCCTARKNCENEGGVGEKGGGGGEKGGGGH